MFKVPPVIVRQQQTLSCLRHFASAALDKAIGSRVRDQARAYERVRPPKNEQLNKARDLLFQHDFSKEFQSYFPISDAQVQIAILRALCGIGEILHEMRADIRVYK